MIGYMSKETLGKIGTQLHKARLQQGMTQVEVADKAGISKNRYAVIERGDADNITINTLEDIVKALGIRGSDIIPF